MYTIHINKLLFWLQARVEEIQKKSEMSLIKSEEAFTSQLRLLEQARDKLEVKSSRMKEELNSTRRQEAHLRALVADLGWEMYCSKAIYTLGLLLFTDTNFSNLENNKVGGY